MANGDTADNIAAVPDWQQPPNVSRLVTSARQNRAYEGVGREQYAWQELGQMYQGPPGESQSSQLINMLANQLIMQSISGVSGDPEYQQMALDLAKQQSEIAMSPEAQRERDLSAQLVDLQLDSIRQAREVGAITGDLSQQEMNALNEIEANAIQTLTEQVNIQAKEVMGSVVSQMVDRGVLQGDIGARAIADVGKEATRLISEGVRDFASQKAASIIGLGEAQKDRQLQLQNMVQSGILSREQLGQAWASQAASTAGARQQLGMGFAQSAQQFGEQLGTQQWESAMGTALGRYGALMKLPGYATNTSNRAALSTIERGQDVGLWGNVISAIGNVGGGYASSYG